MDRIHPTQTNLKTFRERMNAVIVLHFQDPQESDSCQNSSKIQKAFYSHNYDVIKRINFELKIDKRLG
jgi:hypothetical protein